AHADVEHDATLPVDVPGHQEIFGTGPQPAGHPAGAELPFQRVADGFVVVDDVGAGVVHAGSTGSVRMKMVPPSGLGSKPSRPRCSSAIERQMFRPMPMPSCLVVKKGSNRRRAVSGGMPAPWSMT